MYLYFATLALTLTQNQTTSLWDTTATIKRGNLIREAERSLEGERDV